MSLGDAVWAAWQGWPCTGHGRPKDIESEATVSEPEKPVDCVCGGTLESHPLTKLWQVHCLRCGRNGPQRRSLAEAVASVDADMRALKHFDGVVAALELAHPSEADLDWVSKAMQRHTDGIDTWWEQNRDEMSFRYVAEAIIHIWEAGRLKTTKVAKAVKEGGPLPAEHYDDGCKEKLASGTQPRAECHRKAQTDDPKWLVEDRAEVIRWRRCKKELNAAFDAPDEKALKDPTLDALERAHAYITELRRKHERN